MSRALRILGIETSCDETAAAIVHGTWNMKHGTHELRVLSNVVASQIKIHQKTGGVVPEVAARAHVEKIIPVVQRALRDAGIRSQVSGRRIQKARLKPETLVTYVPNYLDVIAVTAGPGLMTSLLVGVEVARTLSWLWRKPVIAVNHLAGHVYANWLPPLRHSEEPRDEESRTNVRARIRERSFAPLRMTEVNFPALCLIVSGGHTELVLMRKHLDFKVVGSTRDDAAGEAFDKVAKMLGLGYPGGPEISREAEQWKSTHTRHSERAQRVEESRGSKHGILRLRPSGSAQDDTLGVVFPRPMIDSPNFDFSFSGLKTAVLYYLRSLGPRSQRQVYKSEMHVPKFVLSSFLLRAICVEFEQAVVDVLVAKTVRAAKEYKVKTVLLGGGVAANQRLRQQLQNTIKRDLPYAICHMPSVAYATDNAAMIAAAGCFMAQAKQYTPWEKLDVDPNWELGKKFKPIPR